MTETSARFALPLLQAGQAQKEMLHNEALALIDALLHPVAQTLGDNAPPPAPNPGECWIVGETPTGEWAGEAHRLALWTTGGWRFATALPGMTAWLVEPGLWAVFDGSGWSAGRLPATAIVVGGAQVVGARQAAIMDPDGGSIVDVEARAAIAATLSALRAHGLIAS